MTLKIWFPLKHYFWENFPKMWAIKHNYITLGLSKLDFITRGLYFSKYHMIHVFDIFKEVEHWMLRSRSYHDMLGIILKFKRHSLMLNFTEDPFCVLSHKCTWIWENMVSTITTCLHPVCFLALKGTDLWFYIYMNMQIRKTAISNRGRQTHSIFKQGLSARMRIKTVLSSSSWAHLRPMPIQPNPTAQPSWVSTFSS